jgi:VCBS repeat-containing protein
MRRARKYALIVAACCLIQFLHGAGSLSLFAAPEYALQFDGIDDRVTFGAAPTLGAQTFTLELWFMRTGAGATTTTGTGGITAVPLLTKGRGEADGNNRDMNYFLGIDSTRRVLAADFEDMATGLNHPVAGRTAICDGIWYHAAATYDGTMWRLYLNGELDAELVVGTAGQFIPRWDSIQHASIGSAITSSLAVPAAAAAGFFKGQIDEARIWNVARSQSAIQETMGEALFAPQVNLIGRFGLDEGSGTVVTNSAGLPNGTLAPGSPMTPPVWTAGGSGFATTLVPGADVLRLSGVASAGDYVSFGAATATLGASTFTLETWFNRSGTGLTTTTGTGALTAVPLVTKGRGEGENSNVDMNYFLGIDTTGVLAADFEDAPNGAVLGGANHPIRGVTVPGPGWNHAAVTYDGTNLQLYLNGVPDGPPVFAGTMPRADSIQHAALGSALTSAGAAAGFFAGALDEARIWNYARSAAQVAAAFNREIPMAPGLLGRWSFNECCGRVVDSTGHIPFGPPAVVSTPPAAIVSATLLGSSWSWAPRADATFATVINMAPVVDAGTDLAVTLPATASLAGAFVDSDGVETATAGFVRWSKTSGPGTVVFGDPNSLNTSASFSATGTYELTLTVNDGELSGTDSVTVVAIGVADPALTPKFAVDFGANAFVALGQAPGLGAARFTLEAWIKREGAGVATSTGSGGVTAIPIVTKGMAQADGTNLDMNYFLGIDSVLGVLAADFEEGVGGTTLGLNHPVRGSTVIQNNVWYHVAATYDGSKWQLFVNGIVDGELVVGQPVRSDSIQHAAIGTALGSGGVVGSGTQGFFNGVMDEVRIWGAARTLQQIQDGMSGEIMAAPGLLGRWGFNEGSGGAGTAVSDSSGSGNNGVLNGTFTWVPGVTFATVNHSPDAPILNAPIDDATGVAASATLDVSVSDSDADPLTVTYFGRRKAVAGPDFTVVAIPDTQHYVDDPGRAATFTAQTNWIVNNRAAKSIAFASHLGDITEHQDQFIVEWQRADTSIQVLEANSVPFGMSPGNHDQYPSGVANFYDQFFPPSRFLGQPWYGGYLGAEAGEVERLNKDNYELFSAGGLDFLVIHIETDWPGYAVQWADKIIKRYPNRRVILSTHAFLNTSSARPASTLFGRTDGPMSAESVWQNLIKLNCNVFMVINGHYPGEGRRTDLNDCGQPVHQVLTDYQDRANGGDGWLRYYTFKPSENKIYAYTYSPTRNAGAGEFETDSSSQFVLDYNLTTPFQVISTNAAVVSGSRTTAEWSSLAAGAEYEWYVTINDGRSTTTGPVWSFTAAAANVAPVAQSDAFAVDEDGTLNVPAPGVLGNDSDADGGTLQAAVVSGPIHGALDLNADGRVIYIPAANYNGPDSFTYKVNDGSLDSNVATVSITVNPVNDAPVAANDAATTPEDAPVSIAVLANDGDADGGSLSVASVSTPAQGTATINGDGTVTYAPAANYNGADSFTYTINDDQGGAATATVTVTVSSVNDAPTALDDAATTAEDTAATIAVLANDTDADGDSLSVASVGTPGHGTASVNGDGTVTYAPAANYNGADSFTYTIGDGQGGTAMATVSVTVGSVNDAPSALDDAATTAEDTAATIAVLGNDTDADGDSLSVASVGTPAHGTATVNGDGTITYAPDADYHGADSFTYTMDDGQGAAATATVSVTVSSVNDGPSASDDAVTTAEDTAATMAVLANDADADGDSLSVASVSTPGHGTASVNGDGTVTYVPAANYNGPDSFTYTMSDGQGGIATATVSVTVSSVNDGPSASDDAATTTEDTAATIAVLANDTDADADSLSVSTVSAPAHGTATIDAGGTITYTPNANYNGADGFTYTMSDGQGGTAAATVSVTITSVNDAPLAVNDSTTTAENTAASIAVLANDTDADGDTVSVASVTTPAHGTAAIDAGGTVTYTPAANYNGTDSFTYTIQDGQGGTATATVSVTITNINNAPVAVNDSAATVEDGGVTIAVLANDTDVDGGTLNAVLVGAPGHGTVALNPDGSFRYTPAADFSGADSFTYKASDGALDSNVATVTIAIAPVNDAPAAANDSYSTGEDQALNVAAPGVLGNDADIDGGALRAVLVSGPSHGAVTLNADGSFSYTPASNFSGADSFTYAANDGSDNSSAATVSIAVIPANDAPVAESDSVTTQSGMAVSMTLEARDAEGSALTYRIVSGPANGTLTGVGPNRTYTPRSGFTGSDSFTFVANDGAADSNVATVSITVTSKTNQAPVAEDQSVETDQGKKLKITLQGFDPDGKALKYDVISGPVHGELSGAGKNRMYTPDPGYTGTDSFTFRVSDKSADSNEATVTITVRPAVGRRR